ncbi:MAG: hypothetical protein DRP63_07245 [Planctomycetota bacterium]|nr:MAG: hypothetical protein DRP63_07245 [Planctomycetota bacterium]
MVAGAVAPATLAFSAPSAEAAFAVRLELASYVLAVFVAFLSALAASRTIATDRATGRLWLIRTRPVSAASHIIGTWLAIFTIAVLLVVIGVASAATTLSIGHLRPLHLAPPTNWRVVLPKATLRRIGSFLPLSIPHLNTALVGPVSDQGPTVLLPQEHQRRIVWLDQCNPSIVFRFDGDGEALRLCAVVSAALKTEALATLKTSNITKTQKVELHDEKPTMLKHSVRGGGSLAITLLPWSRPVGFRLWRNERGLPVTAPLLVRRFASVAAQIFYLWLATVIKTMVFAAAGVLCAAFLSPAISSLFASFLFFLFSSAHYIHSIGVEVSATGGVATKIISKIVSFLTSIVPAAGRFQPAALLTNGIALNASYILDMLLYFGLYTTVILALALLLFVKPPHEVVLLEREE